MLKSKSRKAFLNLILRISLFFILCLFLLNSETFAYNRQAAVDYIKQFGEYPNNNEYNPDDGYYNFDSAGPDKNPFASPIGNCSNAVSQALIAGGMDLSYGFYSGRIENPNGKYTFYGASQETIGVYLEEYIFNELRAVKRAKTGNGGSIPNLAKGDVIIFEYTSGNPPPNSGINILRHVVMVEDVVNGIPILAGDNPPSSGDNFYNKFFGESSEYKFDRAAFYHFPTAEEIGQPVKFWGTNNFYGPGSLAIAIYEAGHNFLGWILNNTDSFDQDMVIGEDTSEKQGCIYYIKGFCSNASKGIPDPDDTFSQPWTSDDPLHWAYWIRLTTIYGTNNNYSDDELLDAIWYITDRSGDYNEILTSIGYSQDGPQKTTYIDMEPPAELSSFTATAGDREVVLSWKNPSDSDLLGVVIRFRTDGIYPIDPTDGTFVTGKISSPGSTDIFTHKGLTNGTIYYYTAFTYDEVSNYSSGSQARATPTLSEQESGDGGSSVPEREDREMNPEVDVLEGKDQGKDKICFIENATL